MKIRSFALSPQLTNALVVLRRRGLRCSYLVRLALRRHPQVAAALRGEPVAPEPTGRTRTHTFTVDDDLDAALTTLKLAGVNLSALARDAIATLPQVKELLP